MWRKRVLAVQNQIAGMNEIRAQIQESPSASNVWVKAQEIGEIVELISDITEQTNVLVSTPPSRQHRPVRRVAASRWLRKRCSDWRNVLPRRPSRLKRWCGDSGRHQDAVNAMEKPLRGG